MRTRMLAAATSMTLLACVDTASAAGGCGPGFHRGPYGGCRPNAVVVEPAAPVVVAPAPVVVAPTVVAPAAVVCGAGHRWHPGLRRCVVL